MKHILLAQALSLILHSALFMVRLNGLPAERLVQPLPRQISVELVAPAAAPARPPEEARVVAAVSKMAQHPVGTSPAPDQPKPQQPPVKTGEQKQPVREIAPAVAAAQPVVAAEEPAQALAMAATSERAEQESPASSPPAGADQGAASAAGTEKNALEVVAANPLYRLNPPPEYPPLARRRGLEGTVQLDVLVSPDGTADTVRLALTSGSELLDRAALAAVEKWLFTPGKKGEEPEAMWVRVPVRFALH